MLRRSKPTRRSVALSFACGGLLAILALAACAAGGSASPAATHGAPATPTPASSLARGVWSEGTTMGVPRSEMAAAVVDGLIYVPGGFDNDDNSSAISEVYNPAVNTWRRLADMPQGRNHHMVTTYGGRVYVFGGFGGPFGRTITRTAWVYDPSSNSWTILAPMPEAREAGAAVAMGSYLYVIGGVGGSQALLRYDPRKNTWTSLAVLHTQREHTAAVTLGGKLYAIGGRWGEGGELATVEAYDPAADAWTPATPMHEVRAGGSAVVLLGNIFVAGGELIGQNSAQALRTTELYDPATQTWQSATPMPAGLHGIPMVSIGGTIFILGGSSQGGGIDNWGRVLIYRVSQPAQ